MDSGQQLGAYEILGPLGAGGMGEVYLALDPRLEREVAIKVLPAELAGDPEQLARLEREARMLAALDHPNIATVHGLEQADGVRFLVMQRVPGETLADRMVTGPVPPQEAVAIATQIAMGLEAAHERGIVHRDLKPANVMVDGEGKVKILDFGLAKPSEAGDASASHLTASPTVMAATAAGVIMGTAPYMSPEQARGRSVDKRTDIWAFGVVLYEMLTGAQPFAGETVSDCIASILTREPDLDGVPKGTNSATRRLLARCLEKDPKTRLRDIGEARILLTTDLDEQPVGSPASGSSGLRPSLVAAAVLVACLLGAVLGSTLLSGGLDGSSPPSVLRMAVPTPDMRLVGYSAGIYLTPDGRTLGYHGENLELRLRDLSTWESRAVPGTENSRDGFLSPDGLWFAYLNRGEQTLEKILLDGGNPEVLVRDISIYNSGVWSGDGVLYFSGAVAGELDLWRVNEDGSGLKSVIGAEPGQERTFYLQLEMLPGDKALLVTTKPEQFATVTDVTEAQVWALMLDDLSLRPLLVGASQARYLPGGYLAVMTAGGSLSVVEFDLDAVEVRGTPRRVIEGVRQYETFMNGRYAVSATGTLAYVTPPPPATASRLLWIEPDGTSSTALELPRAALFTGDSAPHLDPSGRTVAMSLTDTGGQMNVWLIDIERGTAAPFLDGLWQRESPSWSPEGSRLAYVRSKALFRGEEIMLAPVDASAPPRVLQGSPADQAGSGLARHTRLGNWTPDGRRLCFEQGPFAGSADIWTIDTASGNTPELVVGTAADERSPQFSPDGRWLAYAADPTGRMEIYLRAYPQGGRDIVVSRDGGQQPVWRPDGRRLYYREDNWIVAVDMEPPSTSGGFMVIGQVRHLAELLPGVDNIGSVDQQTGRLLLTQGAQVRDADEVRVIIGFADEIHNGAQED